MSGWTLLAAASAFGDLLAWCATCASSGGAGVAPAVGIAGGIAAGAAVAGGMPSLVPPSPVRADAPGEEGPGDVHVVPAARGPAGLTVTHSDGFTTVTTPDGTTVSATNTGGNTYSAALPDGSILAGNADGSSVITAPDGSTTNYNAAGDPTGSAGANLAAGGSLNAPKLQHDVTNPTSDGGYNVSHPDGSVDIHHPDGTAIHVEADGRTWHPLP
jgi:hypothetical protein